MSEKRDKILKSWKSIPTKSLANYLRDGIVSWEDMKNAGMPEESIEVLRETLAKDDDKCWEIVSLKHDLDAYREYTAKYPKGKHAEEANSKLGEIDDEEWSVISETPNQKNLEDYKANFPNGKHIGECNNLLNDLPWLLCKQQNTILSYQSYKVNFPNRHDKECNEAINILNDDKDWNDAVMTGTTIAYRNYLTAHFNGKHAIEANRRIQSSAGHDAFIRDLINDPNSHDAKEIRTAIENNIVSKADISKIFGLEGANAIVQYQKPSDLPGNNDPDKLSPKLQRDSTEVYFWGYRGSGKTCALGSIISSLKRSGKLEQLDCKGYDYMTRLSNIFTTENVCTLPPGTENANVQEMIMNVSDDNRSKHKITLVDLAGELIEIAYAKIHPDSSFRFLDEDFKSLDRVLDYLKDDRNDKIHFFVVEYDSHKRMVGPNGEYRIEDLLANMIMLLKNNNVFRKTTVGVYVLITKSDKIKASEEDIPQIAGEYLTEHFPTFWTNLCDACSNAGIGDLRTIAFSVGKVFAKNLCFFNDKYTKKVTDKFIIKTYGDGNSTWAKLMKFLRG